MLVLAAVALAAWGETGEGVVSAPPGLAPAPSAEPVDPGPRPEPTVVEARAVAVADGFDRPTHVAAPAGDDRLFVAERGGVIRVVAGGTVLEDPFLDISSGVSSSGGEQGLAAIAFHPEYAENGRFFITFTDLDGTMRLVEYRADADLPDRADPATATLILAVEQPDPFHNGGGLAFGPGGELFMGSGDGEFSIEPNPRGQDLGVLQGKILRIDVDHGRPYAVSRDNPFLGEGRPEIWAYGVRNPWRVNVDPVERVLVVGDVGQFNWEELTVLSLDDDAGANLGWPVVEGHRCYQAETCDDEGMTPPRVVYPHPEGCAVIGGPVYRGEQIPGLWGMALFADFCQGWVRAFDIGPGSPNAFEVVEGLGAVQSLGVDGFGEVLATTAEGVLYRLVPG